MARRGHRDPRAGRARSRRWRAVNVAWLDDVRWNSRRARAGHRAGRRDAARADARVDEPRGARAHRRDAARRTTGRARARKLWRKGERSGHVQRVREIRLDCDDDAILLIVEQAGGIACHTGRERCFYKRLDDGALARGRAGAQGSRRRSMAMTDGDATRRARARRRRPSRRAGAPIPASSYVAALFAKGDDAILKKIGEEATETVMAAKDGDKIRICRRSRRSVVPLPRAAGPPRPAARRTCWPSSRGAKARRATPRRRPAPARPGRKAHRAGPTAAPRTPVQRPELHLLQDRRAARSRPARSTRTTTCWRSTTSSRWRRCISC